MSTYTVRSGDTLSALATRFSISISALAKANNIITNVDYGGQNLAVPDGFDSPSGNNIDLNAYKIKLGDNNSNSINKSTSADKWIIDSLDANDSIIGGTKNDNIDSGAGDDTISGKEGVDYIYGAYGADTINGGDDNDKLDGGAGSDSLTGGTGADTFIFDGNSGNDNITDFAEGAGNDVIDFSGVNGVTGFADLKDNHMSVGPGDVAIISWNGGSVFIAGIAAKSDFAANDFIFG